MSQNPPAPETIRTQREIFGRFLLMRPYRERWRIDATPGGPAAATATFRAIDPERTVDPSIVIERHQPWRGRPNLEAAAVTHRSLSNEYLVPYVGHGAIDGISWRAWSCLDGISLAALVRHHLRPDNHDVRPLPVPLLAAAGYIAATVAETLPHADRVGFCAAPSSVFIQRDGRLACLGPVPLGPPAAGLTPVSGIQSVARLLFWLATGDAFVPGVHTEAHQGPLGKVPLEVRGLVHRAATVPGVTGFEERLRKLMVQSGGAPYHVIARLSAELAGPLFAKVERTLAADRDVAERLRQRQAQRRRESGTGEHPARIFSVPGLKPIVEVEPVPRVSLPRAPTPPPTPRPAPARLHSGLASITADDDDDVDVPGGMVLVPAGAVSLRNGPNSVLVDVPAFYMDQYPVTRRQFRDYCRARGGTGDDLLIFQKLGVDFNDVAGLDEAMTGVPVEVAKAYARWIGKRLPTEQEWDLASGAAQGLLWPWGNTERVDHAGADWSPRMDKRFGSVFLAEAVSASPHGVLCLARHWEFTATKAVGGHVVRGGPWRNRSEPPLLKNRSHEDGPARDVTFRCARDIDDVVVARSDTSEGGAVDDNDDDDLITDERPIDPSIFT